MIWRRPKRSSDELRELGLDPRVIADLEAAFRSQLVQRRHPGAQLALYRHGKLALEMSGGIARRSPKKLVVPETLFVLFSATKAWAAVAAHLLIERGKLDLQARVAEYWPEFAKHGKRNVTIYHVLSHRGGYPISTTNFDLDAKQSSPRTIESTPLSWKPGETNGYHAFNFGETIGELVRRVDGREIKAFLREEVFAQIGLVESYLGLPATRPELSTRVAYVYEMEARTPGSQFRFGDESEPPVPEWKFVWNRPETHQMVLPSGGGITRARDFARFYGMLANGGEIDGVRVLKPETIQMATRRSNTPGEIDRIMRVPMPWGLGFQLGGEPTVPIFGKSSSPHAFGHAGAGCTVGWADPDRSLGFAFLTNGNLGWLNSFSRVGDLADLALKACL